MAHKKGLGSSRNGRDSNAKRLGVKVFAGQAVTGGEIIVRQRGTRFKPGDGVGIGKDDTIYARSPGRVAFTRGRRGRVISSSNRLSRASSSAAIRRPARLCSAGSASLRSGSRSCTRGSPWSSGPPGLASLEHLVGLDDEEEDCGGGRYERDQHGKEIAIGEDAAVDREMQRGEVRLADNHRHDRHDQVGDQRLDHERERGPDDERHRQGDQISRIRNFLKSSSSCATTGNLPS